MLIFMDSQDAKLNQFMQAIKNDANERRQKILAEAEEYSKREMQKAEEEALSDAYVLIQAQKATVRNKILSEFSKKELDERKALLKQRENITSAVFELAKSKLISFSSSDEYLKYLLDCINYCVPLFNGSVPVVYIKKDDEKYSEDINTVFSGNCHIKFSDNIIIGGFLIECNEKSIIINETLDSKLADQHDWFSENSGLSVT